MIDASSAASGTKTGIWPRGVHLAYAVFNGYGLDCFLVARIVAMILTAIIKIIKLVSRDACKIIK